MRCAGYTFVELLIAVAIFVILAAAARPSFGPVAEAKLDAASQEVANALRFARGEALRTGTFHGVDFAVDAGTGERRMRVFRTDGASPPNPVYDVYQPLDKKLYDVSLAGGPGTPGVVISVAAFVYETPPSNRLTRDWIAFDAQGKPDYYPDASNYALVIDAANPVQLAVSLAGRSRTVSVNAVTGRVTVQ